MGQTGSQELVSHGISSFSSLLESLGVLFPGIANAELNYITNKMAIPWRSHELFNSCHFVTLPVLST